MTISGRFTFAGCLLSASLLVAWGFPAVADDDRLADGAADLLEIDRPDGAGAAQVVVVGPNGTHFEFQFPADEAVVLNPGTLTDVALAAGQYFYEVRFAPQLDETQEVIVRRREENLATGAEIVEATPVRSGTFRILADGLMAAPQQTTEEEPQPDDSGGGRATVLSNDDGVIRSSLCVGLDCANDENFSFDTLRLKENNTRMTFIDSSTNTGFPAGDWQLRANDSNNGGADHFSIDWLGTNAANGDNPVSTPFRVDGAAPNNALRVRSNGRIGLRTAAPVLDLHIATGDSPGIRLEQTSASGFAAQTWDMAGNEANFFIRDVTGGSRLSFRIRPGAPTSSIDIAGNGNVGIGTASPAAKLHVADGDVRVDGSVYQLSSRAMKTDFGRFDPAMLLDLLGNLDLGTWHYRHDPKGGRHFGPAAEDFHDAFGLGDNAQSISLADMAGVALGAAQALKQQIEERDARIEALTERLERLERALESQLAGAGK